MDDRHSVVGNGSVLVRQDQIVAVWQGDEPPRGTPVDNAVVVDFGPTALIFPGMINLHNHPTYNCTPTLAGTVVRRATDARSSSRHRAGPQTATSGTASSARRRNTGGS